MKKIFLYTSLLVLLTAIGSCDKDFVQVNTNPVGATSLDPGYLFSQAQYSSVQNTLYYQIELVQQVVTPFTGVLEGGNHNAVSDPNTSLNFNSLYSSSSSTGAVSGPVVLLATVLDQTKASTTRSNLYNMARIMKAYTFSILVDTYGDVPYTEAGLGYLSAINLPKYDDQKVIYPDLLNELDQATKALDAAKPIESGDLFYKGNIAQWKKLGYSLMLRLGMRYSKADVAMAQKYVTIAVAGGLMQSNADNAYIQFNATFNHPLANQFQGTERANYYVGKPFVDFLQSTSDPRLNAIAVKYDNPSGNLTSAPLTGNEDTVRADQLGMPFGYNESTIANAPGFPGKIGAAWKYSQVNRRTIARTDAPEFFVTYSQTQLLLAEAVQRGWTTGTVATLYNAAVKADMDRYKVYDPTYGNIPSALQDAYLTANPFNAATALQQINTQYWIASFMNGSEAWANFRRSGFPVLTANPYPLADPSVLNGFVHRLVYPNRDKAVNAANYNIAVARMGPDNLATHIFWDK